MKNRAVQSSWFYMLYRRADSIPGQPILCDALSRFSFDIAAPKMNLPGDTPDEKTHFIRDATFHFLSSTATFNWGTVS